ncbi:ExeM/NucH family extracellular endonuclease [Nocardioides humilatus]|uniref:ExeM/NucH family extracellular endonuclease n=1 Tax=Nocardioides humilatus TaxID=2607660 RepID=A0A5B1L9P5_9ACTN|nr:ExeM/NucH family extracellular endonuclease [Nocardioides humilatus]KAA1417004.1 ExeM/NucH family extracellular endonuclease [Nocardioides humilatus]
MSSARQVIGGVLGLGLTTTGLALGLAPSPAHAVTGVFISEIHYDNSGTDAGEFVEVTAPAGTDLSTYAIVRYNGSNPTAGAVYTTPAASNSLTGTAANQLDGWGTGVVNYPVDGLQNGTADGIALTHNGTLVEFLSWEGSMTASGGAANGQTSVDIGVAEGSATTAGQSLQRQVDGSWTGPATATKGAPNGYSGGGGGGDLAAVTEPNASATVDVAMADVVLEATGGTPPYSWATASTLPAGVSLSSAGVLSGIPGATGTFPITATVTDDVDATDDVAFTLTVNEEGAATAIADVQGTGSASPMVGDTVTVEGVVTATYPTGGFNGFYIQTAGADTTPGASDGVFVFSGGPFDESTLDLGDSVSVTGAVAEFSGLTEINMTSVSAIGDLGDVVPNTVVPGTGCALPGTSCSTTAAIDTAKEEFEGEVFQPTDTYTLTDVYDGGPYTGGGATNFNNVGELGLAGNSTLPLVAPTEIIDAQATGAIAARKAYNDAHRVILDDGSSTTYWNTANNATGKDTPMPWFTPTNQVRVGAAVTFEQPVVLDYRFGWKLQPVHQVVGAGSELVSFEQDRQATPTDVGGDIKLATFNVLNYFTTLGATFGGCSSYKDRANQPIAVNQCPTGGPRGAWNDANFQRQQAKIVTAINILGADIVSVEEIENSLVVDGHNRDEALAALVTALNADAGAGTWDYVDSPAEASTVANEAEQDVIRTAFIYKPDTVELVGAADMLFPDSDPTEAFANAREPFAQAFKVAGADDADGFAVIANHFKSKGSGTDDGTGQGASNPSRIAQAEVLSGYAEDFAAARGVEAIFLTGDFNAYSEEDPMQVLYDAGFDELSPANKWSYSFDGQSGSLDHVLANAAAVDLVDGVDIWETNANETVFNLYSRYNYNATNLYNNGAFGASDHNPALIGIDAPGAVAVTTVTGTDSQQSYGKPGTMQVTVTDSAGHTPAGYVSLKSGSTALGSGVLSGGVATASIAAKKLGVGTHTVTITYAGDGTTEPGTGTATLTVVKATPAIVRSRTTVEYGDAASVPVRVTASGVVPGGTVTLSVGGTEIGNGTLVNGAVDVDVAAQALPASPTGYLVDVAYSGNGFVAAATGTVVLVVQKTATTVTGTDTTMTAGQLGHMAVSVTTATGVVATGKVVLIVNGTTIGAATLSGGSATVTILRNKVPASGTPYDVTVKYNGDVSMKQSTDTVQLTVNP